MAAEVAKKQRYLTRKPKNNPKGTDIKAVIAMAQGGLPVGKIATLTDTNHSNISQILKRYDIKTESLEAYKAHRADILAGKQERLIESLTDSDIKNMSARDRVMSYGILYDKERIERGHSSEGKPLVIINRISVGTGLREGQVEENETVIDIQPVDK
jgi:exopolyphosphatase/pppGpp-phosphohydrolase